MGWYGARLLKFIWKWLFSNLEFQLQMKPAARIYSLYIYINLFYKMY